jgi:outer membrane protein assembly factor BamB
MILRDRVSRTFFSALALLLVPFALLATDWPQWRGPNRDGMSSESNWVANWPAEGPKKLWERKVGVGYSSMSVSKGRIYTLGNTDDVDTIWCLDAGTGAPIWKYDYPCAAKDPNGFNGTRCTPTVDGDRVYTMSRHGHLFCLETSTGKVLWAKNAVTDLAGLEPRHGDDGKNEGWGFAGSPLIEKDLVLVEAGGTNGSSVVALNKMNGALAWKNGNDIAGYASFIAFDLDGQRCFTQFSADHLVVRRMKDGSELWRHPWKTSYGVNAATPIIHNNEIFISSAYGYGCTLLKVSAAGCKEVWRNKNMKNHVNSCVLVNGYLYGFDESELKCLDWNTGEVKWSNRNYGKGSLICADGKFIVFGQGGRLGVIQPGPAECKELCSFQALRGENTWASPVLANGRLYVRNLDTLLALDVKQ